MGTNAIIDPGTKIAFSPHGTKDAIQGVVIRHGWRHEIGRLYYVAKSVDPSHPGLYRVYPFQLDTIFAPPPRAAGRQ